MRNKCDDVIADVPVASDVIYNDFPNTKQLNQLLQWPGAREGECPLVASVRINNCWLQSFYVQAGKFDVPRASRTTGRQRGACQSNYCSRSVCTYASSDIQLPRLKRMRSSVTLPQPTLTKLYSARGLRRNPSVNFSQRAPWAAQSRLSFTVARHCCWLRRSAHKTGTTASHVMQCDGRTSGRKKEPGCEEGGATAGDAANLTAQTLWPEGRGRWGAFASPGAFRRRSLCCLVKNRRQARLKLPAERGRLCLRPGETLGRVLGTQSWRKACWDWAAWSWPCQQGTFKWSKGVFEWLLVGLLLRKRCTHGRWSLPAGASDTITSPGHSGSNCA